MPPQPVIDLNSPKMFSTWQIKPSMFWQVIIYSFYVIFRCAVWEEVLLLISLFDTLDLIQAQSRWSCIHWPQMRQGSKSQNIFQAAVKISLLNSPTSTCTPSWWSPPGDVTKLRNVKSFLKKVYFSIENFQTLSMFLPNPEKRIFTHFFFLKPFQASVLQF